MIEVINLIQTDAVHTTKAVWEEVCTFLSTRPGYIAGQLLETFETVHPQGDYKLTGYTLWESDAAWKEARQAAKNDERLTSLLAGDSAKFNCFETTLEDGPGYEAGGPGDENLVLIDLFFIDPQRLDDFVAVYKKANILMRDKPGYISASLFCTLDESNPIKFVNIAEWSSTDAFRGSLSPQFLAIIEPYKNDCALYLAKKSTFVSVSRLEKAI
jgi:heme-degrading monooxygenase HmoA